MNKFFEIFNVNVMKLVDIFDKNVFKILFIKKFQVMINV